MTTPTKITYAHPSAGGDDLHVRIDAALDKVHAELGRTYPLHINGRTREGALAESRSPIDTSLVVARVATATADDVADAVTAAHRAYPAWRSRPWQERADILTRAAQIVRTRALQLTAWLILESGKNRIEALGEIEETADLYDYYADQMRQSHGYVRPMASLSEADTNTSVMRPYGVWAVIAPWNFPYALLGAPIAAALVTGNTVVCKPSEETPLSGVKLVEIFYEAGVPTGALHLVMGGGDVGRRLASQPDVAGLTFTGSYDVGFRSLFREFSVTYPRPCVVEMGGKNPAIVMDSADLDRAVLGVYRSAFGMSGQKCSACSRVYVHEAIADEFLARLVKTTNETVVGDPRDRRTFLGPVGTREGYETFQRYSALVHEVAQVRAGGGVLSDKDLARGYFVQPTIVTDVPRGHSLLRDELFVPLLAVERVGSFEEAIARANDTTFGLTAGIFSRRDEEIEGFLDRVEAGVVYVNRAAGATTGAWPGVQPFGGWKASGSTGRNIGGLYTLSCYLREQSRTVTT